MPLYPVYFSVVHLPLFYANCGYVFKLIFQLQLMTPILLQDFCTIQENGSGVEHHLHRGRPLAAFNHILGARALKQKSNAQEGPSRIHGQSNIQSDLQTLLAPFSQNEASLLVLASVGLTCLSACIYALLKSLVFQYFLVGLLSTCHVLAPNHNLQTAIHDSL